MIKTKIIATLGPASADRERIAALAEAGVDVFRLNFSHGDLDEHARMLANINEVRAETPRSLAVMGDLCGPKIRATRIETGDSPQPLRPGDTVTITPGRESGPPHDFGVNYAQLLDDVNQGDRVLLDDGQIRLTVRDKRADHLVCEVVIGGILKSNKGVNLPESRLSAPSITPRDWECVEWAIAKELDYLALSFVRGPDELEQLRRHLADAQAPIGIVSKLETPQAIANLSPVIRASDAVLVARGDLGVEMDLAEVPLIQKRITRHCRALGKPVIVATQIMQSMIDNPTPTRAEVSDAANAVMDYTDALMLSGETAVGSYPLLAVGALVDVARTTEAFLDRLNEPRPRSGVETSHTIAVIARHVAQMVDDLQPALVALWSDDGVAARHFSKSRIDVPVFTFSSQPRICRQMCLKYGIVPVHEKPPADMAAFAEKVAAIAGQLEGDQNQRRALLVLPEGNDGQDWLVALRTL